MVNTGTAEGIGMIDPRRWISGLIAGVLSMVMLAGTVSAQRWSPDGSSLAFDAIRDRDRELYVIDIDSRMVRHYSFNRAEDFQPVWSPNGRRLLFFRGRGRDLKLPRRDQEFDIYMIDTKTRRETRLTTFHGYEGDPAWAPDGKGIVFTSNYLTRNENFDIFSKGLEDRAVTRLTNNPAPDVAPKYSPDGKRILFVSRRDGYDQIYVMNADGSNQRRVLKSGNIEFQPDWSPDGTRIVFTSQRHVKLKPGQTPRYIPDEMDIYSANADGRGVVRLTKEKGMDASPVFSPRGKRIAFLSKRDGEHVDAFYFMNVDGSHVSRLLIPPPPKKKKRARSAAKGP